MNNFQIFANHRILDSNLQYCLYITDDHIPVNDTVIRISCQSTDTSRVLSICYYSTHYPAPDSTVLSPTRTNQPSYTCEMSVYGRQMSSEII